MDIEEFQSANVTVDELNLSTKITASLLKQKIHTVSDLENITEEKLFRIRGIGQTALDKIKSEYRRVFNKDLFKNIPFSKYKIVKVIKSKNRKNNEIQLFIPKLKIEQKNKIYKVKDLYDKFGTLQAVGKKLNISRERVRQILEKGEKYNLFNYESSHKRIFENLIYRIKKDLLIKKLKSSNNLKTLFKELNIRQAQYKKLINFYKLDRNGFDRK
ncbi:MAG: hypothetical protein ACD_12C00887G0008 [uncultured bacterium]|nr:MAG: hypothetical protein ACD_12C00887G0008 [uncultured bacterium]